MTFVSIKGLMAFTIFAVSSLFTPQVSTEPPLASVEIAEINATSSVAVIPKTRADCTKYETTIKKYDWEDDIAMEVCRHESEGDKNAIGDKDTLYVSCGLMQIRSLPDRPSCEALKDPEANIAYAYQLWKEKGWAPWKTTCETKVDCSK